MKLGLFSWFGHEMPLLDRVRLIIDAGFDATFFWFATDKELLRDGKFRRSLARMRRDGLWIDNIHAASPHVNDIWLPGSDAATDYFTASTSCLEMCSDLEIPHMVTHITAGSDGPGPDEYGIATIGHLVERASHLGVKIAIENTRRPEHIHAVLAAIDSPWLGLCYDSSHDFLYGQPPCQLLLDWRHRLLVTHLSDNDGREDSHYLPFDGVIDWDLVCRSLAPLPRLLSFEVVPVDPRTSVAVEFLAEAHRRALEVAEVVPRQDQG
jgi:sugar phosphate isomerase/epimerase